MSDREFKTFAVFCTAMVGLMLILFSCFRP
jgi:hypothetical protein